MKQYAQKILDNMKTGRLIRGINITLADSIVSELAGLSGCDFVWIEGEQAAFDRQQLQKHMIAAHAGGAAALVRLGSCDPSLARAVMDMGPDIIGFPFINSAEDARYAVSLCTYPPKGIRGFNPQRACYYGNMSYTDYVRNSREETLVMAVIEQQKGFEQIEEIVQTEGLDLVALGPGDLSLDMGLEGDMGHPKVQELIAHAAAVCKKYQKPFIAFPAADSSSIKTWRETGASALCFMQDTTFITNAIKQILTFC